MILTLFFGFVVMADVMPNSVKGSCYCQADVFCLYFWIWQMLLPRGRWYPLLFWQMLLPMNVADILPLQCIATIGRLMLMPVADGIAACCLFIAMFLWADVIALWQME